MKNCLEMREKLKRGDVVNVIFVGNPQVNEVRVQQRTIEAIGPKTIRFKEVVRRFDVDEILISHEELSNFQSMPHMCILNADLTLEQYQNLLIKRKEELLQLNVH